jgi:beta-1,4-mannosyl-glycoprotein beta-1,4-N-acetylglucosaminyltransferase
MAIYDCFTYFNEDLILDIRLNILDKYVHKFVIVEATRDHAGNYKKLNFNVNNFKKFKKKIEYIIVDDLPLDNYLYKKKNRHQNFIRENYQRNCISRGLIKAGDEDLILISDLDEIPNLSNLNFFKKEDKFALFRQKYFRYKLNLAIPCNKEEKEVYKNNYRECIGSAVCVKKYLKSPQYIRNIRDKADKYIFRTKKKLFSFKYLFFNPKIINGGGWHFGYIQTPSLIAQKFKSFAHGELNTKENTDINIIISKLKKNVDIINPTVKLKKIKITNNEFPEYIVKNKKKFKKWII